MDNVQGIEQLKRRLHAIEPGRGFGRGLMQQVGILAVQEAKHRVHRKTGNLGRTIRVEEATDSSVKIIAGGQQGVGYAQDVEFGTRPHEITPRAARALRWAATAAGRRLTGSPRKGAAVVFAMRVHHPGTKPEPYLRPGAEAAIAKLDIGQKVVAAWNDAA